MRNYFPSYFSHVLYNDGFNNFENFWLAGDKDRSLQLAQADADQLSGSGYNVTDVSVIGKRWWELNKKRFDEILEHVSPQQYWNNGNLLDGIPDQNPRDTGVNSKTEKRAKSAGAGDFKGVPGLLSFVSKLPAVAGAILRSRFSTDLYRRRIAGIVMSIYNAVVLDRITISAASAQFAVVVASNADLFKSIT